jgi:hypothetical protein
MALLNRMRASPRTWIPLLFMAATGGCAIFGSFGSKEKPLAFNHAVHAKEGLECSDCHSGATDSDEPGMPAKPQCMLCHADLDKDKAPDKKIETLFQDGKIVAAHVSRLGPERIFSHKSHASAASDGGYGQECSACHAGIDTNTRVDAALAVTMDECSACHLAKSAPNECATCHREIRKEMAPATHAQAWKKTHGHAVRQRSEETADRCVLCHTESSCTTCHQVMPPDNHNQNWRLRAHGLVAMMDRENCAACHRSDSCERCHADTVPQNHMGMWGSPKDTHCASCHFPLQAEGCVVCHKGTPSHALAPPMPGWHNPGMNCRQCHGAGQSFVHVDNGSSCTMCHH